MKIRVNPHNVEIIKEQTEPVNEKEIKISKCEFEFDEEITDDFVKEAYFTLNGETYKQIIQNNQCDYPNEVLTQKGTLEIGVVAYKIENEQEIIRYNPSPDYYETWIGSLKDAENSEPITPTDKEQIEQQLLNITTQMDNLDVDASKEEHKTTITITKKDGSTEQVEILDGEKGDKGDKGEPGAIEMIIVAELPETGQDDTIYLVPLENPTEEGNNYAEYVYIDGAWELLGKIGVQVDLSDYYTKSETNNIVNLKYTKPSTGIPKTDLDSNVQTSLNKADSAIQDVSNKEDKSNKVTTLSSSSTDTQYPSAKCVYDSQQAQDNASKIFINNIFNLKNYFQHQVKTGTEVSLNGTLEKAPMELMLKGNTEQDTTTGKNLANALNNSSFVNCTQNGDIITTTALTSTGYGGAASATFTEGYYLSTSATVYVSADIRLVSGTTETINAISANNLPRTNGVWVSRPTLSNVYQRYCYKFDVVAENSITGFFAQLYNCSNAILEIKNIMFSYSTDTEYEPYTGGMASPNPDYPQEVKVVTGENGITVCGKNLFDKDNADVVTGYIDGTTGELVLGGTSKVTRTYIPILPNTNMNISGFANIVLAFYDKNKTFIERVLTGSNSYTFNKNAYYIRIQGTGDNFNADTIQLEKGSTATTYAPYKAQNYEINLGKNLLPNNQTTQTINGITFTINTDKSISVSGTSTAQTDLYLVGNASQYINLGLEAGNYNLSGVNNGSLSTYMLYCVQNRNGELSYYQSYTVQGLNISVQSGDTFRIFIRVLNGQTVNTVIYPQLEKGTKATSYAPCFTPIELCKIGYYQDYLYKENGNWYKYSAIGKVVLNGSENWSKASTTALDRFNISFSNFNTLGYSNYFTISQSWVSTLGTIMTNNEKTGLFVNYSSYGTTTLEQFKTWLSTHNTDIYYVLTTLTPTQITEPTLINQLNAIEQAYSYSNQTNITQTNSNLPFIITADMMLEM